MIGMNEILITVGVILLVVFFGKKTVIKGIKEMFSLKREVTEVINEESKKEVKKEDQKE